MSNLEEKRKGLDQDGENLDIKEKSVISYRKVEDK